MPIGKQNSNHDFMFPIKLPGLQNYSKSLAANQIIALTVHRKDNTENFDDITIPQSINFRN